jgi:6-pyruvoyltetrahydropterin/6-carboxytetrahydropterin synthase
MNSNSQPKHRIFVGADHHKFSAAHMTVFPDGTKERLHGHNFHVRVAIDLRDLALESFLDLKTIKSALVACCEAWHERLLLPKLCRFFTLLNDDGKRMEFQLCGKHYMVPSDEAILLPVENMPHPGSPWVG